MKANAVKNKADPSVILMKRNATVAVLSSESVVRRLNPTTTQFKVIGKEFLPSMLLFIWNHKDSNNDVIIV